jgi:endogenous inhibitor of DNA gyrase (YacG/DUF329 family)
MATTMQVTCDICSKKKETTNHWWKFWIRNKRFGACAAELFVADDTKNPIKDACSETCAAVAFTRWMSTGSFDIVQSKEQPPEPPEERSIRKGGA